MSVPATLPQRWATFEDLPAELRNRIYELLVVRDRVVVTSKEIRGRCYTSRFTSAFSSSTGAVQTHAEYQDLLEKRIFRHPGVLRVNIVDFKFSNFIKYIVHIRARRLKLKLRGDALQPYSFPFNDIPTSVLNIQGPYFAANLVFTKSFEDDQQKLQRWLRQAKAIERKSGHLRVFYKVTSIVQSRAFSDMLSHLDFQQGGLDFEEDKSGQWLFIHRALQKEFAPRPQGGGWADGDLNDGLFSDCPVVDEDEEVALRKMFEALPAQRSGSTAAVRNAQPPGTAPHDPSSAFTSLAHQPLSRNPFARFADPTATLPAFGRPIQSSGDMSSFPASASYGQLNTTQPVVGQAPSAHTYTMLPPAQQPPFAAPGQRQQLGAAGATVPDAHAGEDAEMAEDNDAQESVRKAPPGRAEQERQSMAHPHFQDLLRRRDSARTSKH
ncbi:hypothetical protein LTR85_003629 [Meristemomyces frigidus]|nr:hypothetical protein LTR85_003629 [Meristemomyces frigidus]